MNLYPQDLREDYHWEIVVFRDATDVTPQNKTPQNKANILGRPRVRRPLSLLEKIWSSKLSLNRPQREAVLPSLSAGTLFIAWAGYVLLLGFLGMGIVVLPYLLQKTTALQAVLLAALLSGTLFYPNFIGSPRSSLKRCYKALTLSEIEGFVPRAQNDLERAYLTLVRSTVLQTVPEEAEEDVRAAIVSLGEAIDALPLINPTQTDTSLLRGEAAALKAQAALEADTVIADSLSYQAEAVLRRADAADRSAQYGRRITALRREIAAQIAAVQEELSTFSSNGGATVDRAALSHLAESARRVAAISVSATNARAELDRFSPEISRPRITLVEESPVQNLQVTIK